MSDKEWNDLIEKYNVVSVNYDYILFYDLSHKRENWKIAKKMSKILKMPLIITTIPSPRTIDMSLGIKKDYSCGPVEFLSYIKNAKLVLTSSFHGTLFSTIFNIPFFSINSSSDERLSHFLTEFNLINRIIDLNSCCSSAQNYKNINFSTANTKMKEERKRCMEILKKNL